MSSMNSRAASWEQHFGRVYVNAIESYQAAALERILPVFSRIAEEADAAAHDEFARLGARPADPNEQADMADLAEKAERYGQVLYETMKNVRQGVRNLLAVGLHHLFEQQQAHFFRQALALDANDSFKSSKLDKRLGDHGIDTKDFGCHGKVYELRVAANAIKHGAGWSAQELARLRPNLFEDPILAAHLASLGLPTTDTETAQERAATLVEPLVGADLYVTENDLKGWCGVAKEYWLALATSLDSLKQQQDEVEK